MRNVWVMAAAMVPCGARVATIDYKRAEPQPKYWLDVCILGQHLPQLYSQDEMHPLTFENAADVGLCPDCLGFGTREMFPVLYPRQVDELLSPCETCEGSGRPYFRVRVYHDGPSVRGEIQILPHAYLDPKHPDHTLCMACGEPERNKMHVTA